MSDTDQTANERREQLSEEWLSVQAKAERLSSLGKQIAQKAGELDAAAELGIKAAQHGSPYADWEIGISYAHGFNEALDQFLEIDKIAMATFPDVNSSGSAAIYASSELVSEYYIVNLPEPQRIAASQVQIGYHQFFERTKVKQDVVRLLNECGFDAATEGRTAIEKFTNAWEIYESMTALPDSAIGSLISLRESIELVIAELVRRLPIQQKGKDKLLRIGDQVAFSSVAPQVFHDLQNDYEKIGNRLSGAKRRVLSRTAEVELMREGTYFLYRLLSAVDPAKLKQ
jgi:hypothetical protein